MNSQCEIVVVGGSHMALGHFPSVPLHHVLSIEGVVHFGAVIESSTYAHKGIHFLIFYFIFLFIEDLLLIVLG